MRKKLGLLITIALVGLVVVTTIILGVVKKDYSPSVQTNYQSVIITNTNDSNFNYAGGKLDEKESYNKIVELYNNSFKQSILASLFSGNLSNEITVTYSSGSVPSMSGYKIVWALNSEGEKIKLTNNLETEYVINKLTIGIEDSNSFKSVVIYANIKDSTVTHLKITTKANFEALYDYLEELSA